MNWDLTSYFPSFDGPEMGGFQRDLARDLEALLARAAACPPRAPATPTSGSPSSSTWRPSPAA